MCASRMLPAIVALFASAAAFTATAALADDELPGRVGRVANVQGVLHHAPSDNADDWAEIDLNYPVAEGDNLWVDHDGRAEIDYGGGQFRLAGDTNLHVSRLDERQLALFIAAGRVIVRVRILEPDDSVRIDTPATQIELTRPGLYRIDVAQDSPLTTVIVREGEAQVATAAGGAQVLPGQTATLTGVANEQPDIRAGSGIDGFDAWSAARDRVYEQPRQYAYVSRQMVGAADLSSYGNWEIYPEYGTVWFPTSVSPAWAPYRYGRWTWLSGWGYTWVDDAPWGYAPFHYGRWAYIGGRWGWCPGAYVARPIWAPALVAWYGGGRWALAASGGPIYGWVPLGWREPFVPWWGACSARCWARYNHPYALNVADRRDVPPAHYANWDAPGGITAAPRAALIGGRPIAPNRVSVASNAGFTPSLVTRPPEFRPVAPVRRAGQGAPVPASTYARRLPAPAATIAPGATTARTSPVAAPSPATGIARTTPASGNETTRTTPASTNETTRTTPASANDTARTTPAPVAPPASALSRRAAQPGIPPASADAPRTLHAPVPPPTSAGVSTSTVPERGDAPHMTTPSQDPASRIAPARRNGGADLGPLPRTVPPATPALPAPAAPAASAPVAPAPTLRNVPVPSVPPGGVTPGTPPGAVVPGSLPGAIVPGAPPGAVAPGAPPGAPAPAAAQRGPVRVTPPTPGTDR